MKEAVKKADTLIEAMPYIRSFKGRIFVIKFGGSLIDDIDITKFLEDVLFLAEVGIHPVLVHGGGPIINKLLKDRGVQSEFRNGLRVTDAATLAVVKEALVDRINRAICIAIANLGGMAKTLSGYDSGFLSGVKHRGEVDLGLVGEVTDVNTDMLRAIVAKGIIPVISPIAQDAGDPNVYYNINADTAAAAVAAACGAEKMVSISDTHGISIGDQLQSSLTETRVKELIASGVITGGMIPKAEACIEALRGGVRKAHIISGLNSHALLLEIFTDAGVGTEIFRDQGAQFSTAEVMETYDTFVIGNYKRLSIVPVRGKGSHLWDCEGRRYIDFFPGWAVNGLGHCHPRVVKAIKEQAEDLLHVPNNFYIEPQARLARLIAQNSFGGKCFFCNSGAEAVEAAIKLARLNSVPGRYRIISMLNSFHGRTLAAVSATGQEKYHQGFPIATNFDYVPFNDSAAVKQATTGETCAVILEVIQGEGGVNIAGEDYLRELRRFCDERNLLLILDEVQTGMGRTGACFAYQHYGITPDIMALAKTLGGGVAIGAIAATARVAAKMVPGTHASTFGGNPLAARAGVAVFEALAEEGLIENARQMGDHFAGRLKAMAARFPFIREVRYKGLMIGVQLDRPGAPVVDRCLAKGLIINCTHDTVLRLVPAMTITRPVADEGLDILEEVLAGV
ncbi:MAG: acetylglutamate kinase [Planctomycetota bacterium]